MSYQAYELNSGDAINDVQSFCRHLTNSGQFDTSTQPTLMMVERMLTVSHHVIATKLAQFGYNTTQTDGEVVGFLQALNVYDTVLKIELTHVVTASGEPNERASMFKTLRDEMMTIIEKRGLENVGASVTNDETDLVYMTGISLADKESLAEDTDHIAHRFKRGQFRPAGSYDPTVIDSEGREL